MITHKNPKTKKKQDGKTKPALLVTEAVSSRAGLVFPSCFFLVFGVFVGYQSRKTGKRKIQEKRSRKIAGFYSLICVV